MLAIIIISLVAAAMIALAMWRLDWALGLVILLLPFYNIRLTLGGVPFTILEIAFLGLALVFFFRFRLYRLSFLKQAFDRVPFKIPLVIFLAAASLGVLVSPTLKDALGEWRAYFIEAVAFYFIFVNVIRREREQKTVLYALGGAALVVALYSIYQQFTGLNIPEPWAGEAVRRVTAWYGYPVAVALFLAPLTAIFAALLFLRQTLLPRLFSLAIVISSVLAIYYTHSRGAIVALLIVPIGLCLVPARLTGFAPVASARWRAALLTVVIVCVLGLFLVPGLSQKFAGVFRGEDNSTNVRLVLWQGTGRLIQEHWLFGAGLAGFPVWYDQYREARHTELLLYPHDIILNFWVEIGISGLIAWLWLVVNFFRKARETLSRRSQVTPVVLAALAAMVVLLIQGVIDVPYFKNDLALQFWIIIGLVTSSYEIQRRAMNKNGVHSPIDQKAATRYNESTRLENRSF